MTAIKLSKKQDTAKAGTMEDYIFKILGSAEKELSEFKMEEYNTVYPKKERFHFLQGRIDALYMLLTGYNNPLANPID